MTEANREARLLHVHGRVQGVGFRWSLAGQAERLSLQGWVRNRRDSSVEALVWGEHEAVARLIHWAGFGPPAAQVDQVEVEKVESYPAGFVCLADGE